MEIISVRGFKTPAFRQAVFNIKVIIIGAWAIEKRRTRYMI